MIRVLSRKIERRAEKKRKNTRFRAIPGVKHKDYVTLISDIKFLFMYNKDNITSADTNSMKVLSYKYAVLTSYGYLRSYDINPTDIGTIVARYIGGSECIIETMNPQKAKSHEFEQFSIYRKAIPKENRGSRYGISSLVSLYPDLFELKSKHEVENIRIEILELDCAAGAEMVANIFQVGLIVIKKNANKAFDRDFTWFNDLGITISGIKSYYLSWEKTKKKVVKCQWFAGDTSLSQLLTFDTSNNTNNNSTRNNNKRKRKKDKNKNEGSKPEPYFGNLIKDSQSVKVTKKMENYMFKKGDSIDIKFNWLDGYCIIAKNDDFENFLGKNETFIKESENDQFKLMNNGKIQLDLDNFEYYFAMSTARCGCTINKGFKYRLQIS